MVDAAFMFARNGGTVLKLSTETWVLGRAKSIQSIDTQTMTDHMRLGTAGGRRKANRLTTVARRLDDRFKMSFGISP